MRILLTGGAGFIGSALITQPIRHGGHMPRSPRDAQGADLDAAEVFP